MKVLKQEIVTFERQEEGQCCWNPIRERKRGVIYNTKKRGGTLRLCRSCYLFGFYSKYISKTLEDFSKNKVITKYNTNKEVRK